MERDDTKKGSLETNFRRSQGPPRAVAPRKEKNVYLYILQSHISIERGGQVAGQ
jgi:hypothetical protein